MLALEAVPLAVITASTPLLPAAVGELVVERSGVPDLGVEGHDGDGGGVRLRRRVHHRTGGGRRRSRSPAPADPRPQAVRRTDAFPAQAGGSCSIVGRPSTQTGAPAAFAPPMTEGPTPALPAARDRYGARGRRRGEDRASTLRTVFDRLAAAYGEQGWWPARTPFEMMAGALLTQRTAWRNAEQALDSLCRAGALSPETLAALEMPSLEALVRPAGAFRAKAARLRTLARWYVDAGGRESLMQRPTPELRVALLALPGIGPETADDILVYVFARPVFVVDAYARRILSRYGWAGGEEPYDQLSAAVAGALGRDAAVLGEFHALLVEHGKRHCRSSPRCGGCPLAARCRTAARRAEIG